MEFKITMMNMLDLPVEKLTMYKKAWVTQGRRWRLGKNQTEMLEIKNTVTEMKIASDGLINRPDRAKERTSNLEVM